MKNKKAQIFTLLAIFIIVLMFVSFEIFSIVDQRHPIKVRVSTMDNFLNSVEQNLERQAFISGFRIIFLSLDEITRSGNYISNTDSFFNEAFFNGTINGEPNEILIGATYSDLINSINNEADKINVVISFQNPRINITQENPWFVKFTLITDFTMQDQSGLARWEKEQEISASIPITGFEDPLYIINTNALVSKKINQTIYEGIYAQGSDVSNLLSHLNNNYYTENPNAPSFLKRLEGDLSSDVNGIESFVDTTELSRQGISVLDKSIIDYIYFSANNPIKYSVAGMPSWFKIDNQNNHLEKYNVTGLAY